ncbi:MAG: hypothetical protein AAGK66_11045 [Pseudomonadota bacterium]
MRAMIFVTLLVCSACTSSFERIADVGSTAPDWYKERQAELRGQDYPSLADVPLITEENRPGSGLAASQADTLAALRALLKDPRNVAARETAERMRAWAARNRRAVDRQIPRPDFLTDEEIEALRAVFDTPRGRL